MSLTITLRLPPREHRAISDIGVVFDNVALTLFKRHGKSAQVYAEEQVKDAVKKADWSAVKSWHHVGSEIEKLTRNLG